MVTYSPLRVAAFTALLVLIIQKLPKILKLLRRTGLKALLLQKILNLSMRISYFRNQYIKKDNYVKESLQHMFLSSRDDPVQILPTEGQKSVLNKLKNWARRDDKLTNSGRISGTIYHSSSYLNEVAVEALKMFSFSNPLHPEVFPAVRQMESELVQMTINLLNGGSQVCGLLTNGGTESILLAVLAYREWGKKRGISEPEIIVPDTFHASVFKAGYYFGVSIISVKVDPLTRKVNPRDMRKQINSSTVAIFASAPNYTNGIIDPIEELGNLANLFLINFHVDACLGGFLLPFLQEAGFEVDKVDLRLKGITSLSSSLCKYGYCPKGVAVLMFTTPEMRRLAYFCLPDWSGGVYVTPTTTGSRPGLNSVAAWATLMSIGRSGYIKHTTEVVSSAQYIKNEASKIEGIEVVGDPLLTVIAFESRQFNIHAIGNAMTKIGNWGITHLQNPGGIHFQVTLANAHNAKLFVEDLRKAVLEVEIDPDAGQYETAALYGMIAETRDKNAVAEISKHFADCLFTA